MDIIVKKDILDELQAKGVCHTASDAEKFLQLIIDEIVEGICANEKVVLQGFGSFFGRNQSKQTRIVPSEEFLNKTALTLSKSTAKVSQMCNTLWHFVKEMVIRGVEVQIIDFVAFRIEEKKAQMGASPITGQRTLMPATKILVFESEKKFTSRLTGQELQFEPDQEFQKHIARLKSSTILMIVPRKDFFVKTVEYHFDNMGWKVNTAQSANEAKHFIQSGKIYLVILDAQIEDYQSLCEMLKCRRETNRIPLIVMYPKDTKLKKPKDFRICGDEHMVQPFEIKQLIGVSESVLRRSSEEEIVFKQEVLLQFLTIDKYVEKANELCNALFRASGLSEEGQITMGAAFREALANAAQHGNKHRRDKLLEVLYLLDKRQVIIAVTDSGLGFEWQRYVNTGKSGDAVGRARQSHKEGRLGGLGIMMMVRCVNRVEYNEPGNLLTLIKNLNST